MGDGAKNFNFVKIFSGQQQYITYDGSAGVHGEFATIVTLQNKRYSPICDGICQRICHVRLDDDRMKLCNVILISKYELIISSRSQCMSMSRICPLGSKVHFLEQYFRLKKYSFSILRRIQNDLIKSISCCVFSL